MKLSDLEKELHKLEEYGWPNTAQTNHLDSKTRFIYHTNSYEEVQKKVQELQQLDPEFPAQYALTRWYNHWCSKGLEAVFTEHSQVDPEEKGNRLSDFNLKGTSFDLKLTVMPKHLTKTIPFPVPNLMLYNEQPHILIRWFYENQSREQRYHTANRLFIVCCDLNEPERNWQLKRELTTWKPLIKQYIALFDLENIPEIEIVKDKIKSDLIFLVKSNEKYFGLFTQKHTNGYREISLKHRF